MAMCPPASVSAAVWFPWDVNSTLVAAKEDSATENASKYQIFCKKEGWSFKCIQYYSLAAMLGWKQTNKQTNKEENSKVCS